jgi:hypothetical protein
MPSFFGITLTMAIGIFEKKFYLWLMKVLKLEKKADSKTNKLELIISILCFFNGIHLSETEIKVLAYFVVYKINEKTDKLLITSKIVKNVDRLRNIKVELYKKGFLKRDKDLYKSYEVNFSKDFKDFNDDDQIRMMINIDNR